MSEQHYGLPVGQFCRRRTIALPFMPAINGSVALPLRAAERICLSPFHRLPRSRHQASRLRLPCRADWLKPIQISKFASRSSGTAKSLKKTDGELPRDSHGLNSTSTKQESSMASLFATNATCASTDGLHARKPSAAFQPTSAKTRA